MRTIAARDHRRPPSLTGAEPEPGSSAALIGVRASRVEGCGDAAAGGTSAGTVGHRFPAVLGRGFAGAFGKPAVAV